MIMEYFGGKKSEKPLILVGKGLTLTLAALALNPQPPWKK